MSPPVQIVSDAIKHCNHAPQGCPVAMMMDGSSEALNRGLIVQVHEACRLARAIADHCWPEACPARDSLDELQAVLPVR